jgi:transposase
MRSPGSTWPPRTRSWPRSGWTWPASHRRAPGVLGKIRTRVKESAGNKKGKNSTGHGNSHLARILGNAAAAAARTGTSPGGRYRRIARRRGAKKANVAIGRSILVIIWHLLADPDTRFHDLGSGFYAARIDPERHRRNQVRQLEAPGYKVTLEPAA